jgi:hypothetical protein
LDPLARLLCAACCVSLCTDAWLQRAPAAAAAAVVGRWTEEQRNAILRDIESGEDDLFNTHIPLQMLLDCTAAADSSAVRISSSRTSSSSSSSSSSCSTRTNAAALAAAAAAGHQVYDLQWLQDRAAANPGAAAVVPDAHQPFTITMQNPADGLDYVVAHYEPKALGVDKAKNAALLAQVGFGTYSTQISSSRYHAGIACRSYCCLGLTGSGVFI